MELSATLLKNNIKLALDTVDGGDTVTVTRKGKKYYISVVEDENFVFDILKDYGLRLAKLEQADNKKEGLNEVKYIPFE